ncbi:MULTISPECIES: SAP domain-containing protein [unclassified Leucobacter]|uniref:SAP domain-containing protein n=1 Tax=unclassified Leucobacter TaxID=2621730 RepID=UPI0006214424|nr:SAP domain-containing protein [Leucobacter sp. Ag1]KKI18716.1 hypothetical protein XM48_10565 [Leucobacter sp. Ag1]
MTVYHDPNAPEGRVVFGGVVFTDGLTADIEIDEGTAELFKGSGIVEASEEGGEPSPSKADLQAAAADLGLSTTGTKADLQARLDEHAAQSADGPKE